MLAPRIVQCQDREIALGYALPQLLCKPFRHLIRRIFRRISVKIQPIRRKRKPVIAARSVQIIIPQQFVEIILDVEIPRRACRRAEQCAVRIFFQRPGIVHGTVAGFVVRHAEKRVVYSVCGVLEVNILLFSVNVGELIDDQPVIRRHRKIRHFTRDGMQIIDAVFFRVIRDFQIVQPRCSAVIIIADKVSAFCSPCVGHDGISVFAVQSDRFVRYICIFISSRKAPISFHRYLRLLVQYGFDKRDPPVPRTAR